MSTSTALQLQGISKRFGGLIALSNVNLTVMGGERRAILGSNGAGKTTLFNLIAGEFPPSTGRITFAGRDITHLSPPARARIGIGRTYQTALLFRKLTVLENLYLAVRGTKPGRLSLRRPAANDFYQTQAVALAARVGLPDRLSTPVHELAHGQQRQLEIGMALAGEPQLILFDEPAAGLSPTERTHLTTLLQGLGRNCTLLIIEHDMDVAFQVADSVTVMHEGQIIAEGTPSEIQQNQMIHEIYLGAKHG